MTRRLAILGFSPETAWLLAQWKHAGMWRIAAAAGLDRISAGDAIPSALPIDDPREWYGDVPADAVVVTVTEPGQFDEPLKRLAGQGIPVVCIHPSFDALFAHELQMHYGGSRVPALVWYPQRRIEWESQAAALRSRLGEIRQVRWTTTVRGSSFDARVDLTRAAHWCLPLVGRYRAMQAIDTTGNQNRVAWDRISVTLVSHQEAAVCWQMRRGSSGESTRTEVEIEGAAESVIYHFDHGTREWNAPSFGTAANGAASVSKRLEGLVEGNSTGDDWLGVCQSLEAADLIEPSLRRRRMIDFVQEAPTEEAAFKGVMAAGSCGLLLLVLAIFAVGSLYESIRRPRPRPGSARPDASAPDAPDGELGGVRWWRFWPVVPLLIYLLLQLLIVVARRGAPDVPARQDE